MKNKFRLLAMVMGLSLALGACGTKDNGGDVSASGAESLVKLSTEKMQSVTSFTANGIMEMNMSFGEEEYNTVTSMDIAMIASPLKAKVDTTTNVMGQDLVIPMYMLQSDDAVTIYTQADGVWTKMESPLGDMKNYMADKSALDSLEGLSNVKENGQGEINGVAVTRIDGVLTGEYMKKTLEDSGIIDNATAYGLEEEQLKSIFESLTDIPVSFWIAEDGLICRYEMEMTEFMNAVLAEAMSGIEGGEAFKVSLVKQTFDYTGFNNVDDIEIPAEVLAVQ